MKRKDEPAPPPSPPDLSGEEETAPVDDVVIGRAFRWSAAALVVLILGVAGGIAYFKRKPPPPQPRLTTITAPTVPDRPVAEVPVVRFVDVTREAGVTFRHVNGAYGEKLLPETMGSGVAFFDYDDDGDQDLLFINSTYWPWDGESASKPRPTPALYRNDGGGRFEDVTAGSGLDVSLYGMGVAVGDYDNDGRVDVFVTAVGENRLFRNEGSGKFRDVTAAAGVGGSAKEWSTSCAWLDIDNDGDLDLFVCNYVRWSQEIDLKVGFKLDGVHRAYGQPMDFEGTYPYLYRNEGGGRFTDVSAASGIQIKNPSTGLPMAKSLGVAAVDLDEDGQIDLVVANDTVQNFVFHNEGNGTFKEIGAVTGLAFDNNGQARGAMGIDVAHYRNDGALGIAIGNFANEMTALFVSQNGPLMFSDEAIIEGIGPASRLLLKFGLFFFDYDLDGRLDLLTANGHLEEEISKIQQSQTYPQPAQLFWNCGPDKGACFVEATARQAGPDLFKPIVGRASAYGDIDGDGDLDVVLTQAQGPPLLLRNDQSLGHHWFRLKLVGTRGNRDAIGAWVKATVQGQILSRQVTPTRGYLSQSELPLTFGLGDATQVAKLEIIWPGGVRQTLDPNRAALEKVTVIEQPK
jgi:enediyne biosynthesis protein E4